MVVTARKRLFFYIAAGMFLLTCAKQGFPPGGPADTQPPVVVETIPESGATRVDLRSSVKVWFSERIQPASAREAVFITPYPGENVKIRFRGRRLTIDFPDGLAGDKTYVITLGTGIKDYRNNAMGASYTLAFSTGEYLDRGEISGRVFGQEDRTGIDVWAYTLENQDPNPGEMTPDYIVQCDKLGHFAFSHIAAGVYRLFAVKDNWSDRLLQLSEDAVAVGYRDMRIQGAGSEEDSLVLWISRRDTAGPMLERVLARDSGHLILFFDEPVRWDRETRMEIQTVDSAAGSLNVKTTYVDPMQPGQVHVITESQIPQARYICSMIHVTDPSGNPVDSAWSRMEFSGSASPDTLKPRLTRALPAAGELHAPVYGFLDLVFDDAMDMSTFAEGVSLSDTLGNVIQGETVWENPARVRFVPGGPLQSRTWYRVGLSGDLIRDGSGNALMDTLYSFRTQDRDTLSAIAGTVGDPDSTGSGPVIVLARQVENTKVEYRVRLDGPGSFHLDPVLPGLYILSAFRDSDGDGAYSQGWPYPFNPAERFHVFVDTVKVRSRWPNEGNYLLLPR